jgi:hypothetical protein
MSETGTSRTAGECLSTRHDKKARQDEYFQLHGRKAPSRQDQFDAAMNAFITEHKAELQSAGYQRDLFTWMIDSEFFTQYAKKEIDFELADFKYTVLILIDPVLTRCMSYLCLFKGCKIQAAWWRAVVVFSCLWFIWTYTASRTTIRIMCSSQVFHSVVQTNM